MGKAWFDASPEARAVFERADALLGNRFDAPLTQLCFQGPADRINRTDISQPAIFTTSVASWCAMQARAQMGPVEQPLSAVAGLSLGEYTALHLAGALSFEDGLELVTLRGRAMQDAAESPLAASGGGGGMLALIGATDEQAQAVCDESAQGQVLVCANFNAPGQVVLSGHAAACARAAKAAEAMGLRSASLPVAGAFHSPLMAQAAQQLAAALAKTPIQAPRCPVLSNVTGLPHAPGAAAGIADTIRERLVLQLTSPVRWAQSCQWLATHAEGEFIEVAPGKTLAGLMRRIDKSKKVITNDTP